MPRGPLVIVAGTGTGIGKTHFGCAFVRAWTERGVRVAGLKPIESGVATGTLGEDALSLGRMSTFHVKRNQPPYMLARAVSPHLAAREAGVLIDVSVVVEWVSAIRDEADAVVVELPGGLFSPLSPHASNADLARALAPTATLLVAPDRLGVLHDIGATTRAAHAEGVALHGIVLSSPEHPDASTGSNAGELALVTVVPCFAVLPRAPVDDPSVLGACSSILTRLRLSA